MVRRNMGENAWENGLDRVEDSRVLGVQLYWKVSQIKSERGTEWSEGKGHFI